MIQQHDRNSNRYSLLIQACLIAFNLYLITKPAIEASRENRMTKQAISICSDTPNCVSSLEVGTKRYIEPLHYQGSMEDAKKRLLVVINTFKRARVLENNDTYIRTTFTSFLFRFTDDVEFQIDDRTKQIDMKSASRVGYYDLGANRRRCEIIRNRFIQKK